MIYVSNNAVKSFALQAIDFLDKLLRYDHQNRLTAREAMVYNLLIRLIFILLL